MRPSGKWIDIDPESSVCDAARRSLQARLTAVVHHLPLAAYHAQQDTEHVHRLRVSTRRAVAAQKIYRDWLPPKQGKWVRKRLRRIRRTAGTARDLDVLAERLNREYGDCAAPIVAKINQDRAGVHPAIVRLAKRMRRRDRFIRKTAKLVEGIGATSASSDAAAATPFRDWAALQLAEFATQFFSAQPAAGADIAALHQFRIRAKALRYAVEALAPAFGPELRKVYYPVIEELQERLGKINDHVTARDQLREWSVEVASDRDLFCEAADHEVARLTDEIADFAEWWTPERADQLSRALTQGTASTN